MTLPFSLFLALKYMKPRRSYVSVVTVLSLLGVLLGVAVLIIVLSVMSGFDDMWRDKILGFNAHVTVTGPALLENPDEIAAVVRRVPGVAGAAPYVQGPVVIQHAGTIFTPLLRGVVPEEEKTVSQIPASMVEGAYDLGEGKVLLGRDLARHVGVHVGDKILVNSPGSFMSKDEIRLPDELTVSGIFEVGMWEYDAGFLVTSLETARRIYGMEQGAHALKVMTFDPYQAGETARRIRQALGAWKRT